MGKGRLRAGKRQALAGGPTPRGHLDGTILPSEKQPTSGTRPSPAPGQERVHGPLLPQSAASRAFPGPLATRPMLWGNQEAKACRGLWEALREGTRDGCGGGLAPRGSACLGDPGGSSPCAGAALALNEDSEQPSNSSRHPLEELLRLFTQSLDRWPR